MDTWFLILSKPSIAGKFSNSDRQGTFYEGEMGCGA